MFGIDLVSVVLGIVLWPIIEPILIWWKALWTLQITKFELKQSKLHKEIYKERNPNGRISVTKE